jgi:hypothetical protein
MLLEQGVNPAVQNEIPAQSTDAQNENAPLCKT